MAEQEPLPMAKPATTKTVKTYKISVPPAADRNFSAIPFWIGLALSVVWIVLVATALLTGGETKSFGGVPLVNWALGLSALASPIALIWMVTAYLQRANDIQVATDPLRKQLNLIFGEHSIAENRVQKFNAALRDQLELLRQGSTAGEEEITRLLHRLELEKAAVKDITRHSLDQVDEAGKITEAAEKFDSMLSTRLRLLEEVVEKLRGANRSIADTADTTRLTLNETLQELDSGSKSLTQSLAAAKADGVELRDHLKSQEIDILSAAGSVKAVLAESEQSLESLLDRFAAEAETASIALDRTGKDAAAQTQALFAQSGQALETALARFTAEVEIANATLAGTGKDAIAQTQALLAQSGQALETALARFAAEAEAANAKLAGTGENAIAQTQALLAQSGQALETTLARFAAEAESANAKLAGTGNNAVARTQALLAQSGQAFETTLARFEAEAEAASAALTSSGKNLAGRTNELQQIGNVLPGQLAKTAEQLHEGIERYSVVERELKTATEHAAELFAGHAKSIERHVDEFGNRLEASDIRMTQQRETLAGLLAKAVGAAGDVQETLRAATNGLADTAEGSMERCHAVTQQLQDDAQNLIQRLAESARHYESAVAQASSHTGSHRAQIDETQQRLGELLEQLETVSGRIGVSAAQSDGAISSMISRLTNAHQQQASLARDTEKNLAAASGLLERNVDSLGARAARVFGDLERIGGDMEATAEQLVATARQSAGQLQESGIATQNAAAQSQASLQQYLDSMARQLAQLQSQFASASEAIKDRADAAYAQMDGAGGRFHELASGLTGELEGEAAKLQELVLRSLNDMGSFDKIMRDRLTVISHGNDQLQTTAWQISGVGAKITGQLKQLCEDSGRLTSEVQDNIAQNLARIETAGMALQQHQNVLHASADTAVLALERTGQAVGEQTARLDELTRQNDRQVNTLTAQIMTLGEKSSETGDALEQQSANLASQLQQNVDRLQHMSEQLRQHAAAALGNVEEAHGRFGALTEASALQIQDRAGQMETLAQVAGEMARELEQTLELPLNALSAAARQIADEQQAAKSAIEKQTDDLMALFGNLAGAHGHSAVTAESAADRLQNALQTITETLASFDKKAETTLADVRDAGVSFAGEAQAVASETQRAEQQIRSVIAVTGELAGNARALREQVQEETAGIADSMAQITGHIDGSHARLRTGAAEILDAISQSASMVQQQTAAALDQIGQGGAQIREELLSHVRTLRDQARTEAALFAESLAQLLGQFDGGSERLRSQSSDILEQIERSGALAQEELGGVLDQIRQNTAQIRSDLSDHASQLREQAQEETGLAAESLVRLLARFEESGARLKNQAEGVMGAIDRSGGAIQEQIAGVLGQIDRDTAKIHDQFGTFAQKLRGQTHTEASAFADTLAQLLGQIDRGGEYLRGRNAEILGQIEESGNLTEQRLADILEQLQHSNAEAQKSFTGHAEEMRGRAAAETSAFTETLVQLLEKIDRGAEYMRDESTDILRQVEHSGAQVGQRFADILEQIQQSNTDVQNRFTSHAEELRNRTQAEASALADGLARILEQADQGGKRLHDQNLSVLSQIEQSGAEAARQFAGVLEQIRQSDTEIRGELSDHNQALREQTQGEMRQGLREVLEQIDGAEARLRTQAADILGALDKSSLQFGISTESTVQTILDQIGRLDETGLRMHARLQNLGQQLREEQTSLDAAGATIERQTAQMAEQTTTAALQLKNILEAMQGAEDRAQNLGGQVAGQLQGVIIHLREELERLGEHSTAAVQAAQTIAAKVDGHTDDLLAAAAQIHAQGDQLPGVIAEASQQISNAGTLLREQTAETLRLLDGSAGKFTDTAAASQAGFDRQMQALDATVEQATGVLRQFGEQLSEQTAKVQLGGDSVAAEQRKLAAETAASMTQLAEAADRLAHLRSGAEAAHEQFMGKIVYLDGQAQATGKVLAVGSQALAQNITQLGDLGQKAEDRLLEASQGYKARLDAMQQTLQTQLAAIDGGVASTAERLEQQANALRHVTLDAHADIERLLERFGAATAVGSSNLADKTQTLRTLVEEAAQLLLGFGATFDAQLKHLTHAGEALGQSQDYLTGTLEHSIGQVDTLQEKLEDSRRSARDTTEQVGAQLQKLGETLQQHIDRLSTDTRQAVGLVQNAGASWQDQAEGLAHVAQQARGELAAISYAMDALRQKADAMRTSIRGQGQELVSSLTSVIEHIDADDEFDSDDPMVGRIERGLKKIS
ncbi:MAG: hypothetical protein WDO70_11360 [Alphaproteobacteria bacterium]